MSVTAGVVTVEVLAGADAEASNAEAAAADGDADLRRPQRAVAWCGVRPGSKVTISFHLGFTTPFTSLVASRVRIASSFRESKKEPSGASGGGKGLAVQDVLIRALGVAGAQADCVPFHR